MKHTLISRTGKEVTLTNITEVEALVLDGETTKTIKMVSLTTGYKLVTESGNKVINAKIVSELIEELKAEQEPVNTQTVGITELAKELGYSEKVLRRKLRRLKIEKAQRIWSWNIDDPNLQELKTKLKRAI